MSDLRMACQFFDFYKPFWDRIGEWIPKHDFEFFFRPRISFYLKRRKKLCRR